MKSIDTLRNKASQAGLDDDSFVRTSLFKLSNSRNKYLAQILDSYIINNTQDRVAVKYTKIPEELINNKNINPTYPMCKKIVDNGNINTPNYIYKVLESIKNASWLKNAKRNIMEYKIIVSESNLNVGVNN